MNSTDKKVLTKSLAVRSNFHYQLTLPNQKWVIKKVIEYLEKEGRTDSQIKTETKLILIDFKTIAKSNQNFTIGFNISNKLKIQNLKRRIEIIYGVLADKPKLRENSRKDYFLFLIKRRYRSVLRMDYYVNPNHKGYFRYPNKCKLTLSHPFTLNISAHSHWENNNYYYFRMVNLVPYLRRIPINTIKKDPADSSKYKDPVQALNLIFTKKNKPCKGNLQECGRVMTICFLEALREAKNPDKLMRQQLQMGSDSSFFSVYPITLMPGVVDHVGAKALFEKKGISDKDFKVGDHVYIYNHPLYKVFKPTGSWTGEHSYVYKLGNRNIKSQKGYFFGGHGKEGTLFNFYNSFLLNLKTYSYRAYKIGRIHLTYMDKGNAGLPTGCTVTDQTNTFNINGNTFTGRVIKYSCTISYKNYNKNRNKKYLLEKDFLVIHSATDNVFIINEEKDTSDVIANNKIVNPIFFIRTSLVAPGGNVYDHTEWKIYYKDVTDAIKYQPIFKKVNGKISIRHIKRSELFEAPFAYTDPVNKTVQITQPKVDLTPAYKTFLTTEGAI